MTPIYVIVNNFHISTY